VKTIGIIGGMSCVSTALYYDRLNAEARRQPRPRTPILTG
jgi:aspartate/glutamate racemase